MIAKLGQEYYIFGICAAAVVVTCHAEDFYQAGLKTGRYRQSEVKRHIKYLEKRMIRKWI